MSYVSKLAEAFPIEVRLEVETAINLALERAAIRACLVLMDNSINGTIVQHVRDIILSLQREMSIVAAGDR